MSSTTIDEVVAQYAAQVREYLSDLDADDLEDLTGDLEADLSETLADDDRVDVDPFVAFGDPAEYAAEMRAAAGLPAPAGRRRGPRSTLRAARSLLAALRRHRWWSAAADWAHALAPVWWVARGWTVAVLAYEFLSRGQFEVIPRTASAWVLLLVCVIVSAQWGRGRWLPTWPVRAFARLVSVFAVVALPVYLLWGPGALEEQTLQQHPAPAVQSADRPLKATNLFVYDADGHPVAGAQIFDDEGHPFDLYDGRHDGTGTYDEDGHLLMAVRDRYGVAHWNSYPLLQNLGTGNDMAMLETPPWPADAVAPLMLTAEPASTPSPGQTATTTP